MKIIAIALTLLVAGASATPKLNFARAVRSAQPYLITDQVVEAIEQISQRIVDAGLDPLIIDRGDFEYALPVPSIFNMRAHVSNLLFRGASNIVINQFNFALLTLRITFDIGIPELLFNIVDSEADLNLFGKNINGRFSGRFDLRGLKTTGNVRISIGIFTGTTVSECALTLKLGEITSQLNLHLQNVNYSNALNTFMGQTIPGTLDAFESDINELLSIMGKDLIESML